MPTCQRNVGSAPISQDGRRIAPRPRRPYLLLMSDYPAQRPNLLWTLAGLISLGVGIVGIVLPLLPTTPLVLLSAFCFGKGSPRLRAWIHDHAHFGPMIAHWRETGAITRRAKCMAVIAMGAALALSLAMGLAGWLIAVQVICLAGAATFILTRPSA